MNWSGPTFTDSGGFQVMSLGVGFKKVLAMDTAGLESDDVIAAGKTRLAAVDDDGVTFTSHLDGSRHRFTPEISMRIQHRLGADIIFAFGEEAQLQRSRSEDHLSFTYANNIVIFDSATLLYGQWKKPMVRMEQNLYWQAAKQPIDFGDKTFADWQKEGYDRGSRVADPLFVDAKLRDFRLKPESPALSMGFKPFDYTKAGVYGDESWKKLAASLKPLDLEREWGLTEGNIFQGELTLEQLFFLRPAPGWAQYKTPVRNLYMCGSATHPGGGIMGAPGRNAAARILK